jgi:hypothetical protein
MKIKQPSFLMLVTILLLMIVLYNKLHSERDIAEENVENEQYELPSYGKMDYIPSAFLRLTE